MGPGLFGHMGLHQWGRRETKPGGETKAPSLSPSPSPPAMASHPRKNPDRGHPLPVSQRVSQFVCLTGITGSTGSMRCQPQHGAGCPSAPCVGLSCDGGGK